jgi:O-antigen/teichoic acid export membrane protein
MILGPEGMGLISLFNSTIKWVSDSTNFGISMSAVRDISEELIKQAMKAGFYIVLNLFVHGVY